MEAEALEAEAVEAEAEAEPIQLEAEAEAEAINSWSLPTPWLQSTILIQSFLRIASNLRPFDFWVF